MHTNRLKFARPALTWLVSLATAVALIGAPLTAAQAPAASGDVAQAPSPEELEKLVGPIALYPDDLVAIILPAATNPLQIVQADRFLEKRKADPKAPIDDKWDEPVKALVNYPDDLVAVILPASTNPLQIVQADRYLQKRKQDPKAPLDDDWDD